MATTTVSHHWDPTETPYVHGSVPITPNQALIAQIYGIGSAVIVVSFMLYICVYWTWFKPRKLRERAEAIARGDIEEQKPKKKSNELSARWRPPVYDPSAPKKKKTWSERLDRPFAPSAEEYYRKTRHH